MRLASLAMLLASSALFAADPKTDAERLNGTWVFDGYQMSRASGLGQVWTSVVTVADGKFSITKVYGAKTPFTGSFTIDEAKKAIDFKPDGFDLSSEGMPLKLSPCTVPALYKLDGDTLTIALVLDLEAKRPTEFKAVKKRDVMLTLKRAPKDFKAFPAELKVSVVGPDGKPAGGVLVGGYMHHEKRLQLTDKDGKPLVIDFTGLTPEKLEKELEKLPDDKQVKQYLRSILTPPPGAVRDQDTGWMMYDTQTASADGTVKLKASAEGLAAGVLIARDPAKKLMGVASLSPRRVLSGEVSVKLQPECKVTVDGTCAEIARSGVKMDDAFNSSVMTADGQRIAFCGNRDGKLEYLLPPGEYKLWVYGSEAMGEKVVSLSVPKDQSEYAAPAVDLPATGLHKLIGKPAPELTDVVGWKGDAVKLADLKGKVVLLEFWGYWCGPCIGSMPVLYELHDTFKDKGVVIIGVHVDGGGEVTTAKELDEKLTRYKKDVWKDRDLPFASALTSGKQTESGGRGVLADLYGIRSYPSTVLIDRDGKVVGKFHARDAKTAIAAMERILKDEKK